MKYPKEMTTRTETAEGTMYVTDSKFVLFKDKGDINHRTTEHYLHNIWLLAGALSTDSSILLDDDLPQTNVVPKPNHDGCDGLPDGDSGRVTEKRICRCMRYYDGTSAACKSCVLERKWHNVGKYQVVDYEVPMPKKCASIGAIDLLLRGTDGRHYAAEVKPQGSQETLIRMLAETWTYHEAMKPDFSAWALYQPAICFFLNDTHGERTAQAKDLFDPRYTSEKAFQYLLERTAVFYITTEERADGIVDYAIHNIAEEPLP